MLDLGEVGAALGLLAPQSRDPAALARERSRERLDLAHRAAGLARLDAVVEPVDAVLLDVGFDRIGPRRVHVDRETVAAAHLGDEGVRFARQPPGVQREDADREPVARDEVEQHHVLGAEARGERGGRMVLLDAGEEPPSAIDALL